MHTYIYNVSIHIHTHTYEFKSVPPPPMLNLVGVGGGGLACAERVGAERAMILRKPETLQRRACSVFNEP